MIPNICSRLCDPVTMQLILCAGLAFMGAVPGAFWAEYCPTAADIEAAGGNIAAAERATTSARLVDLYSTAAEARRGVLGGS
jgi:hypothetical protein